MQSKKAQASRTWWIIIAILLGIIVVALILMWFKGTGDEGFASIGVTIDSLGDCDGDGVANAFDKCPCIIADAGENEQYEGCPAGITEPDDDTSCCEAS